MKTIGIKFAFLVLLCGVVAFEVWHFKSGPSTQEQASKGLHKGGPEFALLPANEASKFAGALGGPKSKVESWEPTVGDMNDVEANLSQISEMSKQNPDPERHIDNPADYFRQYIAIVIDGRRAIFVNAFCNNKDHENDWRKVLIVVHDGGKCYWHAIYDSSAQKFSDLAINGVS